MCILKKMILFELQGTLMAFTAFSRGQVLDRLRSAALLSPISHMSEVNSPIARIFADTFLAEVTQIFTCK